MGHNYYGEPAWPNDLLYMFPVCILGVLLSSCIAPSLPVVLFSYRYSGKWRFSVDQLGILPHVLLAV